MKTARLVTAALAVLLVFACGAEPAIEPAAETAAAAAPDWTSMVKNGRVPFEGVLTGGQPSDEELAALAEAGFATVINLRQPDERGTRQEPGEVARLGMTYVSIPVDGTQGLTEENARALQAALAEAERPVLLHCGSGNRVGALLALKTFWLEGASAEEAMATGAAAGLTRLAPAVREIVEAAE